MTERCLTPCQLFFLPSFPLLLLICLSIVCLSVCLLSWLNVAVCLQLKELHSKTSRCPFAHKMETSRRTTDLELGKFNWGPQTSAQLYHKIICSQSSTNRPFGGRSPLLSTALTVRVSQQTQQIHTLPLLVFLYIYLLIFMW